MLPFNKRGTKKGEFEGVYVGEKFGPEIYPVTDHMVKCFAFAQDDYDPWTFSADNPFEKRIAQAACLSQDLLWIFMTVYDPNTVVGLHTQEELWFHSPAYVGETITTTGEYIDKFEKRGKGYCVLASEVRGEDGRLIMTHRGEEIMRIVASQIGEKKQGEVKQGAITGEYDRTITPAAKATKDIAVGTPTTPLVKHNTNEQTQVFSNVGQFFESIHADIHVAKKSGYDGLVVQGQQQVSYVTEMLRYFFGASWFTSGYVKIKMLKRVIAGETLTCQGVVVDKTEEDGRTKLHLHVWAKDSVGDLTVIGWASAFVE